MTIGPFLLFCITYIFYLLGDLSFPVGELAIPVYFIIGIAILIILLARNYKLCLSRIRTLLKTKVGKFLLLFIIWAVITILVSIPQGTFKLGSFFTNFIGNFFNSFLFPMLICCILIPKIIINRKIKLFLFCTCLTVLVIGMIEFVALSLNIEIIKTILKTLVNRNELALDIQKSFTYIEDKLRIESIFREPGEYAGFLVVSSPIFFYLGNLKEKLFNNIYIDICLKKLLLILWFLNFIQTQSPINFVFIGIVLFGWVIANTKNIIKNIMKVKYFAAVSLSVILLISVIAYSTYKQELYLKRIVTTVSSITSIDEIVYGEPSLATRICTHEAQIRMGLHYPVFGVGYANMNSVWADYVYKLPHAITPEVAAYAKNKKQMGGSSFLWKVFAETGFPGVIFLYVFWITLFIQSYKLAKTSKDKDFINAFNYSLLIYLIFSWYLMLAPVFMIYCGILLGMICKNKEKKYIVIKKAQ